ncbi:MAG: TIGR02594 family protein [Plesiomonas shigelloides]
MTPYEIAKGEIGQKEIVGPADNQRIVEYHGTTTLKATDDETPWCSAFVNWCHHQAGIPGTNSAAARSWLNWGVSVTDPQEGDVVIFKRGNPPSGHVAFFVKREGDIIRCLGGNQSDQVKISGYKVADVLGYRRAA